MIVDNIENIKLYAALNPRFAQVAEFISQHTLKDMEEGKHPIDGADLFVNIQTIKGKTREAAALEWHRRMIDIQIPLSGEETYGYTPLTLLPDAPFNEEKDVAKLPDHEAQTYVTVKPGQMAIFFPQDGHAPCISNAEALKKAIFKVRV